MSASKAAKAVDIVTQMYVKEQDERDIQEIVDMLRNSRWRIMEVKAMLHSSIKRQADERFKKGVLTLQDVPFKHMKAVLQLTVQQDMAVIVNLPNCAVELPH
eukprot:3183347-Lingulodinium_polyedra.AAC.1